MKLELAGNAQAEMRAACYDGAPGILISGLVWVTAAVISLTYGAERGIWTLLIGGVLISPLADLLTKALGRSASPPKGNPLTALAIASTLWLIVNCAMAYGLSRYSLMLFFPAMMAVIGCRYMVFATLFNRSIYLVLGSVLVLLGMAAIGLQLKPWHSAALGGLIEIGFAVAVFRSAVPLNAQQP